MIPSCRTTAVRRALVAAALAVTSLVGVAPALGAGITLDRSPSPPQAIRLGTGVEQISFGISYTSTPVRYEVRVKDQAGVLLKFDNIQVPSGTSSPITGSTTFTPGPGSAAGRYRVELDFFSVEGGTSAETTASAIFDVAPELGALTLVKFEDMNGNGARDAGEPGVPGWHFDLKNPQGNTSGAVTGADGSVTFGSVPAGIWTVTESSQVGWVAITPVTATVNVPPNGSAIFAAGNARPAPLSGTIFIDVNRNGTRDTGEATQGGVAISLTGADGLGRAVTAKTTSASTGLYEFPGLLPGRYTVTATVPAGFSATTATTLPNIGITSAVPSPNHDVGIVPGTSVTVRGNPTTARRPGLSITKRGPPGARRGRVVTYTIVVRNTTATTVRNVVLADPVPARMTLVGVPTGATVVNGAVTWRLGTMAPGATRRVTMRVRLGSNAPLGSYVNTATVTATGLTPRRARTTLIVTGPRRIPRTGAVTG